MKKPTRLDELAAIVLAGGAVAPDVCFEAVSLARARLKDATGKGGRSALRLLGSLAERGVAAGERDVARLEVYIEALRARDRGDGSPDASLAIAVARARMHESEPGPDPPVVLARTAHRVRDPFLFRLADATRSERPHEPSARLDAMRAGTAIEAGLNVAGPLEIELRLVERLTLDASERSRLVAMGSTFALDVPSGRVALDLGYVGPAAELDIAPGWYDARACVIGHERLVVLLATTDRRVNDGPLAFELLGAWDGRDFE